MARIKLTGDLEALFPGDDIIIAGQTIPITPLGPYKIINIAKHVKKLIDSLEKDHNITFQNIEDPKNLITVAVVILEEHIFILEEASNIDKDDLLRLPLDTIVELLLKVAEVNLKDRDALLGNWRSLLKILGVEFVTEKKESNQKKLEEKTQN